MSYKPSGYSSAAPYLVVHDAQAMIGFLGAVFDAEPLRIIPRSEGMIMHGEVRIDDTVIMFADGFEGWPPIQSHVHVYVPDVDATYAKALAAGAQSVQAPEQKNDADKRGGFQDASGITWWVATQLD